MVAGQPCKREQAIVADDYLAVRHGAIGQSADEIHRGVRYRVSITRDHDALNELLRAFGDAELDGRFVCRAADCGVAKIESLRVVNVRVLAEGAQYEAIAARGNLK